MRPTAKAIDRMRQAEELKSDAALARYLGVRRGAIADWRHRNSVPVEHILAFVAKNAVVSVDWLLGLTDEVFDLQRGSASDILDVEILQLSLEEAYQTAQANPEKADCRPPKLARMTAIYYKKYMVMIDQLSQLDGFSRDALLSGLRKAFGIAEDDRPY